MNIERIFINERDIAEYGARALRDTISVGGSEIKNEYFKGRNRTNFTLMSCEFGLKPVSFTLVYMGKFLHEVTENKSKLESEMYNGCEIHLPDGFYYRAMLESMGERKDKGVEGEGWICECKYTFKAIQHEAMITVPNGSNFIAVGTIPHTDCILSVTVGTTADHYTLGGADFGAVTAGDVLVFDGINKRFLKNGAPTMASSWVSFPSVKIGVNHFTALDTVKVQYYPCYL